MKEMERKDGRRERGEGRSDINAALPRPPTYRQCCAKYPYILGSQPVVNQGCCHGNGDCIKPTSLHRDLD